MLKIKKYSPSSIYFLFLSNFIFCLTRVSAQVESPLEPSLIDSSLYQNSFLHPLSGVILNVFILLITSLIILSLATIMQGVFMYYVASGNEDRINAAKSRMIRGTILLAILFTLFATGRYLINKTKLVIAQDNYGYTNSLY